MTNPLQKLHDQGQAVWLDFLARKFTADGKLKQLVEQDAVTGVTSNPSIFEKAIGSGTDYDAGLKAAEAQGDFDAMALFEHVAVEDIQNAAAVLRPVYDATKGYDGYVSLEVSPYKAMDTEATIAEGRRLWQAVDRPNLMIKVPATTAGLPAIRTLLSEGINVNITLLFSQAVYEEVVGAYLDGLEKFVAGGGDASKIASVASFFVSRIDVSVDKLIDERLAKNPPADERAALEGIKGKVAIANAKLAYQRYLRLFAGPRWETLKAKGARVQRLLWASTGTKNPAYSDVLYVEELIAPDTVNTMPPATMDAFRDHGKVRASLVENIPDAQNVMKTLDRYGISIDKVTDELVTEGVQLFADAADKLLGAVAHKRAGLLGATLDRQSHSLPKAIEDKVQASLETWRAKGNIRRLYAGDATLWTNTDEAKWLGWLDIVAKQILALHRLTEFARDVKTEGFTHILLLGMGGSSLGPEVFGRTFERQSGSPFVHVLDSTDPCQIRTIEAEIDLAKTLFIVSSKSGSTLEPNILKQYFYERASSVIGHEKAAAHFIAITDPGSKLQKIAETDKFRAIFFGEPSIGGRYSVLSNFGMVPAAAMGLDIGKFLGLAQEMVLSCAASSPPSENPGVILGTILGTAGLAGHDKVTIITSPDISDFGAWLEQLLAESTGKLGKGLIPVADEPLGAPEYYGTDRLFAYLRLTEDPDEKQDEAIDALEEAGHPVVRIEVADRLHIGQEFYRWEMATAVAGAILGINPFDQPDVEASKIKTRELTDAYEKSGKLPEEAPLLSEQGLTLYADPRNAAYLKEHGDGTLVGTLRAHFGQVHAGDYCALLAYIERNRTHHDALEHLRVILRNRLKSATCVGFGPRFLHSTGQAYKGGPNTGVFLQITCGETHDLDVPGQKYSFGIVKAAQAAGDMGVLVERGRRALRVDLGTHVAAGLIALTKAVHDAIA